MGRMPARGQEGSDHYMAPINVHGPVMACMQEIQAQVGGWVVVVLERKEGSKEERRESRDER
jgi:hypothetical protein